MGRSTAWAMLPQALMTIMLTGCEVRTDRWLDRQAAVDPPELWRVEVLDGDANPVEVCVDSLLRTGFTAPLPEVGGQPCTLIGKPVESNHGRIGRCTSGGQTLLFSVTTAGQPSDFNVTLRVETLDRQAYAVTQTRRYTRMGPCPPGWNIGENTDQDGHRRNNIWPPAWSG